MKFRTSFLLLLLAVSQVQSANILFFFGISSYSHRVPIWPLVEELAERGHKITFVSPFPAKEPNPKVYDYVPKVLTEWLESLNETASMVEDRKAGKVISSWFDMPEYGIQACQVLYEDPEFVKWVKDAKFDLVVIDSLMNDCGYGMAWKFGAKIILFSSSSIFSWSIDPFGLPDESSSIPSMIYHYPPDMTLLQRMVTALESIYWTFIREWLYFPKLEALSRKALNTPDMPGFAEIERNISLMLVNTHYSEEYARSLPPNVISVGGMHCSNKTKSFPKELDSFLQKGIGDNGFIYISFGSYADISKFTPEIRQIFFDTMKAFSQIQFVVKWEKETPDGLPKNVYMSKWMPQQDILAHPKIRAFVTHSGLMGTQEAIFYSVPLISIPIFAEQDYNAERIHRKEYGIRLEITTLTKADFVDAISRILKDEKYRKNMKKVSRAFHDRPQSPLATALWWTEFVLRHDDFEFLKPRSASQPAWKRRNLDIWTTLIAFVILSFYVFTKIFFICCFRGSRAANSAMKLKKS